MPRVRLTRAARADLIEIWSYLATDSETAADRVLDRIGSRLDLLARSPHLGRRREELRPSLRSFPVGDYLIFYQVTGKALTVVRVLHGSRDLASLFEF
ncbi:MAG: type II toxin-antitoxin system RelE/ParE family toxin [Terriglobales bacterium]